MAKATNKPKKRQLRKVETVRERASKSDQPKQPRRLRKTAGVAASPFRLLFRLIGKVLQPFRFLLWPLKLRPVRFMGRILATVLFLRYFRNSWRELRLVEWPDRRKTTQLTLAVFMFAIFFGLMVSLTDYGLDRVFKRLFIK